MSSKERSEVSRRGFIKYVATAAGAAIVAGVATWLLTRPPERPPAVTPVTVVETKLVPTTITQPGTTMVQTQTVLTTRTQTVVTSPTAKVIYLTGWTYDVAKVQQNIAVFEKWTLDRDDLPDIKIEYAHTAFGGFADFMAARFLAGTPVDVTYCSDTWLAKWADAGWIIPIDEHKPEIRDYLQYIEEWSAKGLQYKGHMYGLPYYTDCMYLVHNFKMLERAGIDQPPKDWDELTDQALKLKQKGVVEYPINLTLRADPWLEETLYAMTYSRGGHFFNEKLEPLFGVGSELYDALQWIVDAYQKHKILHPATLENTVTEVKEGVKNGDLAFAVLAGYYMGEINSLGISKTAGQCDVALMPGRTRGTVGWMRFYAIGKSAIERGVLNEAYLLLEFLGGMTDVTEKGKKEWYVAKRWAVENVLGHSIKPLWEDPAVVTAFKKYMNTDVVKEQRGKAALKEGIAAPWYAEWVVDFRKEVQEAVSGKKSVEDALNTAARRWEELKKA
jgi:multiple sugar transport system substrate-binding protein